MSPEYSLQNAMMIRETIEGLSQEVLHEPYTFSEEDEMYLQGISLGEKLIQEAEQKGHVKQMCTQPEENSL